MYTLSENILGKRINSGRLSQLVYLVANTTEIVLFGTEIQHPSSEKKQDTARIFDVVTLVILSNILTIFSLQFVFQRRNSNLTPIFARS